MDEAVDIGHSTDVHPLRRLIEDQGCGIESQAACNDDLLLIPAAQGHDIDIGAAAANSQALYPLVCFAALEELAELPAPPEVAQARDRQVLSQEQIRNQPASRAVSRQQHKTSTQ